MHFQAIPSQDAHNLRSGAPDAHGNPAERSISDGHANPCRYCLCDIPKGAGMLILAYKPFTANHAYAETGPIFLCEADCAQGGGADLPQIMTTSPDYLAKGYCKEERIVYGTGKVIPADQIIDGIKTIFHDPNVAFVHVRSSRNNCFQVRVSRTA